MKLVRIFVSEDSADGLWSIQLDGEQQSEFDKFLELMNNTAWLYEFFEENKADLESDFWGNMTIGRAVLKTTGEIGHMEDALYDSAEQGFVAGSNNLQHLFKPLNNFEYAIATHQKSKVRILKGWLRVYAIRLAQNCYLVTGGAIKLTRNMERKHLQKELKKLDQARMFLRNNEIDYPEDLNTYQNE